MHRVSLAIAASSILTSCFVVASRRRRPRSEQLGGTTPLPPLRLPATLSIPPCPRLPRPLPRVQHHLGNVLRRALAHDDSHEHRAAVAGIAGRNFPPPTYSSADFKTENSIRQRSSRRWSLRGEGQGLADVQRHNILEPSPLPSQQEPGLAHSDLQKSVDKPTCRARSSTRGWGPSRASPPSTTAAAQPRKRSGRRPSLRRSERCSESRGLGFRPESSTRRGRRVPRLIRPHIQGVREGHGGGRECGEGTATVEALRGRRRPWSGS